MLITYRRRVRHASNPRRTTRHREGRSTATEEPLGELLLDVGHPPHCRHPKSTARIDRCPLPHSASPSSRSSSPAWRPTTRGGSRERLTSRPPTIPAGAMTSSRLGSPQVWCCLLYTSPSPRDGLLS